MLAASVDCWDKIDAVLNVHDIDVVDVIYVLYLIDDYYIAYTFAYVFDLSDHKNKSKHYANHYFCSGSPWLRWIK